MLSKGQMSTFMSKMATFWADISAESALLMLDKGAQSGHPVRKCTCAKRVIVKTVDFASGCACHLYGDAILGPEIPV